MKPGEGGDFARVSVVGLEFVCAGGKAVAVKWTPDPAPNSRTEVPESVAANGCRYDVELLTRGLFAKSAVRSVAIPKTVNFVPDKCFEFCESLCDVVFLGESRVNCLGKCCFKRCGLREFVLPDSCVVIGDKCFDGCSGLCRVFISESSELERICRFAFRGCKVSDLFLPRGLNVPSKKEYSSEEAVPVSDCIFLGVKSAVASKDGDFLVSDDCIISKDRRTLFHCFSQDSNFEVPDSIEEIGVHCFTDSNVRSVVFGEKSKISRLGQAFTGSLVERVILKQKNYVASPMWSCDLIDPTYFVEDGIVYHRPFPDFGAASKRRKRVIQKTTRSVELFIDDSVSSVSEDCVAHPESLERITFDARCKYIEVEKGAFRGTGVKTAVISGVATVSPKCFLESRFLKSVSFTDPCGVGTFSRKVFSLCDIESLCVPKGLREIGAKCFYGCHKLRELVFEEGSSLLTVGEKAFMNTALVSLVVPCGVENIQ